MKFTIYFLNDPVHETPTFERYKDALLNFDENAWYKQSSGGASFSAKEEGRGRWTLTISPQLGHGLSLLATVPGSDGARAQEFASTTDASKMNEFMRTGQDVLVPVGSFVTPQQALCAIEDFLRNPRALSPRLEWTNTSTLNYPLP